MNSLSPTPKKILEMSDQFKKLYKSPTQKPIAYKTCHNSAIIKNREQQIANIRDRISKNLATQYEIDGILLLEDTIKKEIKANEELLQKQLEDKVQYDINHYIDSSTKHQP